MLYSVCVLVFSWLICNPAKEGKAVCVCECVKDGWCFMYMVFFFVLADFVKNRIFSNFRSFTGRRRSLVHLFRWWEQRGILRVVAIGFDVLYLNWSSVPLYLLYIIGYCVWSILRRNGQRICLNALPDRRFNCPIHDWLRFAVYVTWSRFYMHHQYRVCLYSSKWCTDRFVQLLLTYQNKLGIRHRSMILWSTCRPFCLWRSWLL